MRAASRVERLEAAAGLGGDGTACACPGMGAFEVRYYLTDTSQDDADGDDAPAEVCGACGRPKNLLKVVYAQD